MWGLNAVGVQVKLAVSGSTALTVPTTARHAIIGIDTANVRWRHDATAPAADEGVQGASGSALEFMDPNIDYHELLVALRFYEEAGSPLLQVLYFD